MQIELIEPTENALTQPLQRYYWPDDEDPDRNADLNPITWDDLEVMDEDRSHAAPVFFEWHTDDDREGVTFDLIISEHPDLKDPRILKGLTSPRAEVLHLHIATLYYWTVVAHHDGSRVSEGAVRSFTTHSATPRWITVPGITNVRDVGGWPLADGRMVRQGMVYRSSEMNNHVEISEEGQRVLLEELGIKTDLDLRGEGEDARPVLDTSIVNWVNIPVWPYGNIANSDQLNPYRQVFEIFADPDNYPILFHCWGGADRAGTVALMLGALLGKSREQLARDYELTSFSIWGIRSRFSEEFIGLLGALEPYAPGGTINKQVEKYLMRAGVTDEEIASIRDIMIV